MPRAWGAAVGVGLVLLGAAPATAAAPAFDGGAHAQIRFSEELGLSDLSFRDASGFRRVDFACEPQWKPVAGSDLHVFLEHAPEVDADRSFLVVTLNHGVLRSLRLDEQNVAPTEITLPLPPGMLKGLNQLAFGVEQAPAPGRKGQAWTLIRSRSYVSIAYERQAVSWNLSDLPAPLLPRRSYRPRRLAVLLPGRPAPETKEAFALAVAKLVNQVSPQPVALSWVRSLKDATDPILAVGTPPELGDLPGLPATPSVRWPETPANRVLSGADGRPIERSIGVLELVAQAPVQSQPLLVVTGNSSMAARRAARSLLRGKPTGKPTALLVPRDPPRPETRPREWNGFLPPTNRITLGQVGDDEAELAVSSEAPARLRIRVTPDTRFLGQGHQISLVFRRLPALFEDPDASLDVYWNEVLIRRAPLRRLAKGPYFSFSVDVPVEVLRQENTLTASWNSHSGAWGAFAQLEPESELYLPREYVAQLPDLARLGSFLYPFSLRGDLSDTVVVPLEDGSEDDLPLLGEVAALLGRLAPRGNLDLRVIPPSRLGPERAAVNLLVIETTASAPARELPLPDLSRLPGGTALERLPLLQELASPWNREKYVLRLRAASPTLLRAAVRSLSEPAFLARLSGDTAFLAAEGPVCFSLNRHRTVAEISYLARLEAWLRANWLALPLIVGLASALLFVGLRLVLAQYRASRSAPPARAPMGGT